MDAVVTFPGRNNAIMAGRVAAVLPVGGSMIESNQSIPADIFTNLAAKPGEIVVLVRFGDEEAALAEKNLTAGEPCRIDVTVERFHPIRLVLPD